MELKCKKCGKEINFPESPDLLHAEGPLGEAYRGFLVNITCDACADARAAEVAAIQEQSRLALLADSIGERMAEADFPENFRDLEKPFCRELAEKVWKARKCHIAITGETGTGKTSSMALVARKMMLPEDLQVKYYTLSSFLADVTRAKKSDWGEEAFWKSLRKLDLLIVDEIAGRRGSGALTPAGQDALFRLLDMAYCQEGTKIWIAGNIYAGSMEALFEDPAPAIRRLDAFRKIAG